jgi:enoyl-CoA hydratase/carnithine racemase
VEALSAASQGRRSPVDDPELRQPLTFPLTVPKPIVAAIHGACAGTGFIQASVCDVRFTEPDARITPAFARRGIMAEHGLSVLVPHLVGLAHSLDLLLSARVISGEEAHRLGFARLARPGAAIEDALDYARDLAEHCSPVAMAVTKRQLYAAIAGPLEDARRESLAIWREMRAHGDFAEGVQSYREKRPPRFAPLDAQAAESYIANGRTAP